MLVLIVFVASPPNGHRILSEYLFLLFSRLGHQMAPGCSQHACFERFRGLATKWPQDTLRMLVLNVFAASRQIVQDDIKMFVLSVFAAWPPNGPGRLSECLF